MRIFFRVRMFVVNAMVARPPDRPALDRHATRPGNDELEHPARFVAPMREVAVVAAGQREDADGVEDRAHGDGQDRRRHEKDGQSRKV